MHMPGSKSTILVYHLQNWSKKQDEYLICTLLHQKLNVLNLNYHDEITHSMTSTEKKLLHKVVQSVPRKHRWPKSIIVNFIEGKIYYPSHHRVNEFTLLDLNHFRSWVGLKLQLRSFICHGRWNWHPNFTSLASLWSEAAKNNGNAICLLSFRLHGLILCGVRHEYSLRVKLLQSLWHHVHWCLPPLLDHLEPPPSPLLPWPAMARLWSLWVIQFRDVQISVLKQVAEGKINTYKIINYQSV